MRVTIANYPFVYKTKTSIVRWSPVNKKLHSNNLLNEMIYDNQKQINSTSPCRTVKYIFARQIMYVQFTFSTIWSIPLLLVSENFEQPCEKTFSLQRNQSPFKKPLKPRSQQIVRFFVVEDLLNSCRGTVLQNVKKIFQVVTSAKCTSCPRWFHDGYTTEKNVIVLSWVCRKSVVRQSYDNRVLFGAMF